MKKQHYKYIPSILILVAVCCFQLNAQTKDIIPKISYSEEFVHHAKELYDWSAIDQAFQKRMSISPAQSNLFFVHISRKGLFDMKPYFEQVQQGKITTRSAATAYWIEKLPLLEQLYKQEKNNLPKDKIYTGPSVNVPSATCNNLDFTSGRANWAGKWCNTGSTLNYNTPANSLPTTGFSASPGTNGANFVHELMTPGTDPYAPIQRVPPGHTSSLRLGSDEPITLITGYPYNHQMISNTFKVSPANPSITYWYAVVFDQALLDPHPASIQPYFKIRLLDKDGNEIKCAAYDVNITEGIAGGFKTAPIPNQSVEAVYKDWVQIYIPLINNINENVTIQFESSDCAQGGHFGYAYIAVDCNPFQAITTTPFVCGNDTARLTAPAGSNSYIWSGPGIIPPNNTQSIKVNKPGKYTVQMSVVGNGGVTCKYNLDTTITGSSSIPVADFSSTTVCIGSPTTFKDLSTPLNDVTNWAWDFNGDGVIDSNVKDPTYTYQTAGTFNVKLDINVGPCGATITKKVVVEPLPVLKITDPAPVCDPNTINITDVQVTAGSSAGTLTYWQDAAATVTLANPNSIKTSGTYYIKLTSAAGCSVIQPVKVNTNPLPSSLAGPDVVICSGDMSASIGSASIPGYTYEWTPGTGLTSTTISNPGITTTNNGTTPIKTTYTLVTTVAATGCKATDNVDVTVNPQPILVITNPDPVCTPLKVDLTKPSVTANSTAITGGTLTYWTNSTATDPLSNPNSVPAGTYYIKVVMAGGCSDLKPVTVTINPLPISNAGPDVLICTGDMANLGTAPNPDYAYQWSPQTGLSNASVANPTVSLTNTGKFPVTSSYIVTTTNLLTGCSSTDTVKVTVNSVPTVNAGSAASVCPGARVKLTGMIGGSATSAMWSGGNGTFDDRTKLETFYTPTAGEFELGTVTLTLTTNDPAGPCTFASSDVILNFYKNPTVSYTVDKKEGCPEHCVVFKDSSFVSGSTDFVENWSWNFGDPTSGPANTSSLQNPKHCYKNTGVYTVSLKVISNHGCVSSLTTPEMIRVFAIPTAEFYPTPNPASVLDPVVKLINGSSPDVVSWTYHFGDGDSTTPSIPSPVHKYPEVANSSYMATLFVKNKDGCVNRIEHLIEIGPEFTFYIPNAFTPDGDNINDKFSGKGIGIVTYDFTIFDRWGNLIFHSTKLEDQWDGRANGGEEIAQQDVYVWKVKLTDCFGKKHSYIGTVTLVK